MHPVLCSSLDWDCLIVTTQTDAVYLFNLSTGAEPHEIKSSTSAEKKVDLEAKGIVLAAALSPSKKYVAICDDFKQLRLYHYTGNHTRVNPKDRGSHFLAEYTDTLHWKV